MISRRLTQWVARGPENPDTDACHAWTDDPLRTSAGLGWITTEYDMGAGPAVAQRARTLGTGQTAFDDDVAAIEEAVKWFGSSRFLNVTVYSESTNAIVRAGHSSAGRGQQMI
jgi:hypothetical protein